MFAYVIKTNGTKYKAQPYGYPSSAQYKKWREQKTRALNNRKREKVKGTQKRQKHTYLKTDGHTFLTFCPIFGISRISKIRHLVSSRGNPTKKPILPSLKKIYIDTAPAPSPPSTASYIPTLTINRSTTARMMIPVRKGSTTSNFSTINDETDGGEAATRRLRHPFCKS